MKIVIELPRYIMPSGDFYVSKIVANGGYGDVTIFTDVMAELLDNEKSELRKVVEQYNNKMKIGGIF